MSLYVTELSAETTEADLVELLGQIDEVNVTKFGKFAFAYYSESESAHQAITRLNHTELKGKAIKLSIATKTLAEMMPKNFTNSQKQCDMCKDRQFTLYCSCSLMPLCEQCFFVHMKQDPFIEHTPISPEAYEMGGHVHRNQETLRQLSQYLNGFYINENQVIEQIENYRDEAFASIDTAKQCVTDKLEQIKANIQKQSETAVNLIKTRVDHYKRAALSQISEKPEPSKWVTKAAFDKVAAETMLTKCYELNYSVGTESNIPELPASPEPTKIHNLVPLSNTIIEYDILTGEKRHFEGNFRHIFKSYATWCLGEPGYYYYSGGENSRDAWKIDTGDWTAKALLNMKTGRSGHASIYYENDLYVFGGGTETCERHHDNQWTLLPDLEDCMFKASCCAYEDKIYIGGSGSTSIHAFSPVANVFSKLQVKLPNQGATLASWKGNLYILQAKYVIKYDINTQETSKYRSFDDFSWWSLTSMKHENSLYLVMVGNDYLWQYNFQKQQASHIDILKI